EEKNQLTIEQSIRTLAGTLPWQQGLMMLAADLFPLSGGPSELAGNIRLQVGWGGCWHKKQHARLFNFPGLRTWAEHEYLTYQANQDDEYTLELAGLSVLPTHRGKKIARFLAEAWALFILLNQDELQKRIGTIASLYANILTTDAEGKYPFYEQVVRPLFGGLDYDTVDAYRNARSAILDEFLDERGDQPRARILCHLLPDQLRQNLGKVRDESAGCRKNLERLGFCRTDKFDVLDGGQYFENTIAQLDHTIKRREYVARCAHTWELPADAPRLTVAPAGRSMSDFCSAQARCRIQGNQLFLEEEVYDALQMEHNQRVIALASPTLARRQDDDARA